MRKISSVAGSANGSTSLRDYHHHAKVLVKDYVFADDFLPYTSVLGSIFACKVIYDITKWISNNHFKSYSSLTKVQRAEWHNRGLSTVHAIFITYMSLYFVFWSDLFSDGHASELIIFRASPLSTFTLGVSVGYFFVDLALICWLFPTLGGKEYILHHSLSATAVLYSMLSREGQLYTFMVLISEMTTPAINLRWYLDVAGLKDSIAYLINGIVIFFSWLGARILLFGYMFYHVYLHHHQVVKMHVFGYILVFGVPFVLAVMNLMWFWKILKGLKKTIMKQM